MAELESAAVIIEKMAEGSSLASFIRQKADNFDFEAIEDELAEKFKAMNN